MNKKNNDFNFQPEAYFRGLQKNAEKKQSISSKRKISELSKDPAKTLKQSSRVNFIKSNFFVKLSKTLTQKVELELNH